MICPLCGTRKARRGCPALNQTICAVCCGTKRLVEIACPPTCPYLTNAAEHPAAVVVRQQERDLSTILPTMEGLTERQHQLFFLFQTVILKHKPEGFSRLVDDDVADAAGAVAATLETAARGVIYEHAATSLPGQRLALEIKALLAEMREKNAGVPDREAAATLRAIERGARAARGTSGSDVEYLTVMGRLMRQSRAAEGAPAQPAPSSLIIP